MPHLEWMKGQKGHNYRERDGKGVCYHSEWWVQESHWILVSQRNAYNTKTITKHNALIENSDQGKPIRWLGGSITGNSDVLLYGSMP